MSVVCNWKTGIQAQSSARSQDRIESITHEVIGKSAHLTFESVVFMINLYPKNSSEKILRSDTHPNSNVRYSPTCAMSSNTNRFSIRRLNVKTCFFVATSVLKCTDQVSPHCFLVNMCCPYHLHSPHCPPPGHHSARHSWRDSSRHSSRHSARHSWRTVDDQTDLLTRGVDEESRPLKRWCWRAVCVCVCVCVSCGAARVGVHPPLVTRVTARPVRGVLCIIVSCCVSLVFTECLW